MHQLYFWQRLISNVFGYAMAQYDIVENYHHQKSRVSMKGTIYDYT